MINSFMYRDISDFNIYLKSIGLKSVNYIEIHNKFIEYFKNSSPRDRLIKRDKSDIRLKDSILYTENHHILPKSQGGDDSNINLVKLLPEEHIFIHYLRYKAFNTRTDMLAYRFCLNGMKDSKSKILSKALKSNLLNKYIKSAYKTLRQESYKFRQEHGWQTKDGRKRISKARKGKISVIDSITRESRGCVTKDHPKYISGEWIHHSKGSIYSDERRERFCKSTTGEKNSRYSGQTDEEFIDYALEYYRLFNIIPTWGKLRQYVKIEHNIELIKSLSKFRFNYKDLCGVKGYIKKLEDLTGDKHNARCSFNCYNITEELINKYKEKNN